MVQVTQEAAGMLLATLTHEDTPENMAVRLRVENNELQMALGEPLETDFVVEADGRAILVMEQGLADALGEATFGAEMTEDGPMLTLSQPEAEEGEGHGSCGEGCGCGH